MAFSKLGDASCRFVESYALRWAIKAWSNSAHHYNLLIFWEIHILYAIMGHVDGFFKVFDNSFLY
jgi:hypothetical protein